MSRKKIFVLASIILVAVAGALFSLSERRSASSQSFGVSGADISVVAQDLEIPWDIAFLPDGRMLVTERPGRLLLFSRDGSRKILLPQVGVPIGEGGLLGITLHPRFDMNGFVYVYLTARRDQGSENRIERYVLTDGDALRDRTVIMDGIPAAEVHDGGRIEFGPDGMLYAAVGEAGNEDAAQDPASPSGAILRINDDGTVPEDNPFDNAVYSYGHRNPQGLAWDSAGRLWSTEHGRSGAFSGYDEVNLIERGVNYGWPVIQGNEMREGMRIPAAHSGATTTWAPASALYYDGSLFFGGLRGEALYEAVLDGPTVIEVKEYFKGEFGRIRTVRLGPDGFFYITTSNRDGRGEPQTGDDRIIRIDPRSFRPK